MTDTVARFRERARSAKAGRRRRRAVVLLAVVGPVAALAALAWSPLVDVEEVRVDGTRRLPPNQVLAAAGIDRGTPLATVDVDGAQRRIAALPYVRGVVVRREWPDRVVVEVDERVPALAVPVAGGVVLYDAEGVRLGGASAAPTAVPLLRVAGGRPGPALVRAVVAVVGAIPASVRADVLGYTATSVDEVGFALRGNREVVWGGADDSPAKAAVLVALLRRPGTHYDVRAPAAPAVR